jgi:hypothetical protein
VISPVALKASPPVRREPSAPFVERKAVKAIGIERARYYAECTEKDLSCYIEGLKANRKGCEKAVLDVFQKYSHVFQKQMLPQANGR